VSGLAADDPRHGTNAGYARGCGCAECRAANAAYMREYRKSPEAKTRSNSRPRATSRALWKLAGIHSAEFQSLYAVELAAERRKL